MHKYSVSDLFRGKPSLQYILLVLLYLDLSSNAVCQTHQDLRKEIETILHRDTDISMERIPGFIVGIIDADSTFVISFGKRSLSSALPLTSEDVFELGSITKVFTADIILQLDAQGLLDVHQPLNDFLPVKYQNPSVKASLLDILMHRSGLPKIPETLGRSQQDYQNPYAGFTMADLLEWYHDCRPGPLGEFIYSHAGYALLEHVIEQVTHHSYVSALDVYISSNYLFTSIYHKDQHALTPGYNLALQESGPWSFQSFKSSEGLQSCLDDLITYVRCLLKEDPLKTRWNWRRHTGSKRLDITPGWYLFLPKPHFPVYVHTGRTEGHSAMICFSRKTHTGVIVLANSSAGTDDLALLILRMINKRWRRKG